MISPSVIKLTLPSSKYHQTVRKTEISISITANHQFYLNNQPLSLEELELALKQKVVDPEKFTVVIRCDKDVPVQDLVDVLQIGNKLKIRMILATKAPNA